MLEDELGSPLLKEHRKVIETLELIEIEKAVQSYSLGARGRPPKNREAVVRALLAKHVLNLPTTGSLIHRLEVDRQLRYICGWQPGERVPSESTFSRAFASLSEPGVLDLLHAGLVQDVYEDNLVFHAARDSMPIPVRERGNTSKDKTQKYDRYRCESQSGKKLTVCEYQGREAANLDEMLAPLPTVCDIGKKTNPFGVSKVWRGYKLHMDVANGCIPISCILTSASTHDSQAAVPLSLKSASRSTVLYELMDSAYDVNAIKDYIESQDRVPVIKPHKRKGIRKETIEANEKAHRNLNWFTPKEVRLRARFPNERLFARLGDSFLGSFIWVRGPTKVLCHVMLGVLALFASEVLRL